MDTVVLKNSKRVEIAIPLRFEKQSLFTREKSCAKWQ
jgi:hypothetical protein